MPELVADDFVDLLRSPGTVEVTLDIPTAVTVIGLLRLALLSPSIDITIDITIGEIGAEVVMALRDQLPADHVHLIDRGATPHEQQIRPELYFDLELADVAGN